MRSKTFPSVILPAAVPPAAKTAQFEEAHGGMLTVKGQERPAVLSVSTNLILECGNYGRMLPGPMLSGGESGRGLIRRLLFPQRLQTSVFPPSRGCQQCNRQASCRWCCMRKRSSRARRARPTPIIRPPREQNDNNVITVVNVMVEVPFLFYGVVPGHRQ